MNNLFTFGFWWYSWKQILVYFVLFKLFRYCCCENLHMYTAAIKLGPIQITSQDPMTSSFWGFKESSDWEFFCLTRKIFSFKNLSKIILKQKGDLSFVLCFKKINGKKLSNLKSFQHFYHHNSPSEEKKVAKKNSSNRFKSYLLMGESPHCTIFFFTGKFKEKFSLTVKLAIFSHIKMKRISQYFIFATFRKVLKS